MARDDTSDTFRILVSTDNHLGVWEKDEVRKDDSFNAFEEVLQLAQAHDVDLLLLGGDLFHDNKPSRPTVIRAIELLHKYCLGDRPVAFQVVSNQQQNFVSGSVNFSNPHINVGLPVFTIHGNHDDPAGQDNLSAVDLLSSCGLVNYFGKQLLSGSNIGRLSLSPVLLVKGGTKLALYGLGNVRDERLGRLFSTPGCVQWLRPASGDAGSADDWLNVFVLHQNRVQHGPTAKNCLQERHLPPFLDLVIWGHEHECKVDPEDLRNPVEGFEGGPTTSVIQPGSSVATALSEGESVRKHVALLEVKGTAWRVIKLALDSVRPFVWGTLVLKDAAAAQGGLDPEDEAQLTAFLEGKVQSMITQARAERNSPEEVLPLIRLRVDYTGFSTLNSQRFGQRFVSKVANPHDILLWSKAAARKAKEGVAGGGAVGAAEGAAALGLPEGLRPEQLDQVQIEDLVARHLGDRLELLPQDELAVALHDFVDKDEKNALAECVTTALQNTQAAVAADGTVVQDAGDPLKEEDIAQVVNLAVQTRRAQRLSNPASTSARTAAATGLEDNIDDLHDENHQPVNGAAAGSMRPPLPRPSSATGAAAAGGGGGLRQTGLREMFAAPAHPTKSGGLALTASSPAASAASRGGRAGRGAARSSRAAAGCGRGGKAGSSQAGKRKRKAAVVEEEEDDDDDEDMEAELAAALEEGISEDEEEAPPASKRAKGATRRQPARSQRTTASHMTTAAAAGGEDLSDLSAGPSPGVASTRAGRKPRGRAAAAVAVSAQQHHAEGISDPSDDLSEPIESDEDHVQPAARGRGHAGRRTVAAAAATPATAGAGGRRGSQAQDAAAAAGGRGHPSQLTGAAGDVPSRMDSIVISDDEDAPPTAARPSRPAAAAPAPAAGGGGGGRRRMPASFAGSAPNTSQRSARG